MEWKKEETENGPPVGHRIDQHDVVELLEESGFTNIKSLELNQQIYIVLGDR